MDHQTFVQTKTKTNKAKKKKEPKGTSKEKKTQK